MHIFCVGLLGNALFMATPVMREKYLHLHLAAAPPDMLTILSVS